MSTRARRNTRARARHGIDEALTDAADAIADMAQRVQLNGPEPTYASRSSATRSTSRPRRWHYAASSSKR